MNKRLALSAVLLFVLACGVVSEPPVVSQSAPQPSTQTPVIITFTAQPSTQTPAAGPGLVCNSGGLFLRSEPAFGDNVLAVLYDGQAVKIVGNAGVSADMEMWQAVIVDGLSGYVDPKYICK